MYKRQPENYVTREEACTYLVNAIKFMGLNITDDYMNVKPSFVDFDSVSEEHKNEMCIRDRSYSVLIQR